MGKVALPFSETLFFDFNVENYSEFNEFSILYKTIGVGLISVVSVFQILSFIWSKKTKINKKEIDKIGK